MVRRHAQDVVLKDPACVEPTTGLALRPRFARPRHGVGGAGVPCARPRADGRALGHRRRVHRHVHWPCSTASARRACENANANATGVAAGSAVFADDVPAELPMPTTRTRLPSRWLVWQSLYSMLWYISPVNVWRGSHERVGQACEGSISTGALWTRKRVRVLLAYLLAGERGHDRLGVVTGRDGDGADVQGGAAVAGVDGLDRPAVAVRVLDDAVDARVEADHAAHVKVVDVVVDVAGHVLPVRVVGRVVREGVVREAVSGGQGEVRGPGRVRLGPGPGEMRTEMGGGRTGAGAGVVGGVDCVCVWAGWTVGSC